jgi:methylamine dehydrogenase accessory protein MauD
MMLILSQAMLWTTVLILAATVVALARQIGVLHERISPVGALALGQGPQPGEQAPRFAARSLAGTAIAIGSPRTDRRDTMIFFVSPTCPVCKQLLPTAQRFAEAEAVDLLLVGDGDEGDHRAMAKRFGVDPADFVVDGEVARGYRVGKLPYAVLVDGSGTIVSQGLVNTREHLESLMAPRETGFAHVQDYLRGVPARAAADHEKVCTHG